MLKFLGKLTFYYYFSHKFHIFVFRLTKIVLAMKKIYLTIACVIIAASLQAQTVLKFQSHGLVADHVNEMKITKYAEPGNEGMNVVWDFRSLELVKDFTGTLDDPAFSKGYAIFTESNTVLEEFGNYFYFKANEISIEQHGFMSGSGNTTIVYDQPFVKMRYPFTYGSSYAGSFGGTYNSNDRVLGSIQGSYAVSGDGMGTLMLPENMTYDNALRVKEIKSYTQTLNNRSYEIETVTYRWYINEHRFPILVFIQSTSFFENGRTHVSTQAAYNPIKTTPLDITTMAQNLGFSVFPNPYRDQITIRFNLENNSKINLSVYDLNGRLVKVLYTGNDTAGEKNFKFSAKEMGLSKGAYIVKLNVNGAETSQKIVEL